MDNDIEASLVKANIIKNPEKIIKNDENLIKSAVKLVKPKAKRVPNEAQLAGLAKGRANRVAKLSKQKEENKIILEEKIIKKAIAIKKRQINKHYNNIDDVSDDDTPIEEIKQKQRAMTPPPVRFLPQVIQSPIQNQPPKVKTFSFL